MMLNSITATYPGFQSLPKGIKKMLLVSESVFFEEARAAKNKTQATGQQAFPDTQNVPPEILDFVQNGGGQSPRTGLRAG
jgi:hypothetical protein